MTRPGRAFPSSRRLVTLAVAAVAGLRAPPGAHADPPARPSDQASDDGFWREAARPGSARARALVVEAVSLLRAGNAGLAAAVRRLEEAVALDPGDAVAWFHLGRARRQVQTWGGCADALVRAEELDPDLVPPATGESDDPQLTLPLCLALSGRYEEAVARLGRLLAAGAVLDRGFALWMLGDSWHALGRLDDAVLAYRQAMRFLGRSSGLLWFSLAMAYDRDERAAEAEAAVREGRKSDPLFTSFRRENVYWIPPADAWYAAALAQEVAAREEPWRRPLAIARFRAYLASGGTTQGEVQPPPWGPRAARHLALLGPTGLVEADIEVRDGVPGEPVGDARARPVRRAIALRAASLQECLHGAPAAVVRVGIYFPLSRGRARRPTVDLRAREGPTPAAPAALECIQARVAALALRPLDGVATAITFHLIAP